MKYFSTNRKSSHVTFREAVIQGQPSDGGLYFPEEIPKLSKDFWRDFATKSKEEIAFQVMKPYVGDDIDDQNLSQICAESINFEFPLVKLSDSISVLELFHGPTLAFKDVGARFMSRCLRYFAQDMGKEIFVIVATSGDTGGAVANGFYGVEGIQVFILYPKNKISKFQEMQIAGLGGNINAIEVCGDFDDCQQLVKTALGDDDFRKYLTSANSINIARLLPQQFYYFFAYQQWHFSEPPVICVPSGNFGNLCAGFFAHFSGLPCEKFIAACNANDVIPIFLQTGKMINKPAVETLSNAMDIARPSNFVRILELFDYNLDLLREKLEAFSISDEETVETMRKVLDKFGYILDPHGAVGFCALQRYLFNHPNAKGFFLETAHPIKFDSVKQILPNCELESFQESKNKQAIQIEPNYEQLKKIIKSRI
jgi:threonine synthase